MYKVYNFAKIVKKITIINKSGGIRTVRIPPFFRYRLPNTLMSAVAVPPSISTASTTAIIRIAALLLNIALYPLYTPRIFSISAAMRSALACAASRVDSTAVIYTLIFGSVPDGRTMTLSAPSSRY